MAHTDKLTLENIAPELFLKIIGRFRELNDRDGWRIFVQSKFPSLVSEFPYSISENLTGWKDLACMLTIQSRAWDRRAFSTHCLTITFFQNKELKSKYEDSWPNVLSQNWGKENHGAKKTDPRLVHKYTSNGISLFQTKNGRESRRDATEFSQSLPNPLQSTSFHPIIDSKLEFASSLSSKNQVVAWSTGPEFVVWIMRSGTMLPKEQDDSPDHSPFFDENGNKINWFHVEHNEFSSGIDDITSINLVEPNRRSRSIESDDLVVDLIAGRASGFLHRYSVSNKEPIRAVSNTFHSIKTQGQPARRSIRSAHVSKNIEDQLLVAISDKVLSLYKAASENYDVWPIIELEIEGERPGVQAWTTKFLSQNRLVVGLGKSTTPIQIYQTTSSSLVLTNVCGLSERDAFIPDTSRPKASSVYAIQPLTIDSHLGGSHNGDVFLTGWYDGICRLYDLRASGTPVSSYHDPVDDDSAIYSICAYGQERFLAGSADSVVKIFDFRNGAKVYYHTDGLPCSSNPPHPNPLSRSRTLGIDFLRLEESYQALGLSRTDLYRPNANLFLYGSTNRGRGAQKSPIYALSSPSGICPLVYAGTNGMVYELEISDQDRHGKRADPFFPPAAQQQKGKRFEELVIYETNDGRFNKRNSSIVPHLLRASKCGALDQSGPPLERPPATGRERRLDERWIF